MAPNAVTTGHCQIQTEAWGRCSHLSSVDLGRALIGIVRAKPLESLELLHFTIPKNELKSHVFPFKLQHKNNSNRLSNLLLDHLSFTVAAN